MFKNHLRQDIYQPLNFSAMNFWNTAVNTAACPRRLGHDLFQWPGWKPSWWLIVETGNKNKDPSLRIQENKAIKRWTELAAKPPAASECTSSWARSKAASQWFKPIFFSAPRIESWTYHDDTTSGFTQELSCDLLPNLCAQNTAALLSRVFTWHHYNHYTYTLSRALSLFIFI